MKHDNLACSALTATGNHSDDRATVWYGAPSSIRVCGWHASQLDARAYAAMRDAGVTA